MDAPQAGASAGRQGEPARLPAGTAAAGIRLATALGLVGILAGGTGPETPGRAGADPPGPPGPPVRAVSPSDTVPTPGAVPECPMRDLVDPARPSVHAFYFTRTRYTSGLGGWGWGGRGSWSIDFPKADRQFLYVLRRLLDIDAFACENPVRLDDPGLRHFPFLYMVEPGRTMALSPEEAEGLRSHLLAGGFLLVDDFWGTAEWAHFEREMRKVFPDRGIVEIPMDHPVFHIGFQVEELLTVPSINNARRGVYHERDGTVPHMRGIFDEGSGRLMVAIAWNTDLGDAWEWAEQPDYPRDRSDYAFKMGVNFVLYAMTH